MITHSLSSIGNDLTDIPATMPKQISHTRLHYTTTQIMLKQGLENGDITVI